MTTQPTVALVKSTPSTQQAITFTPPKITNLQDLMTFGKVLAESGFFKDSRGAAQAVVKVQAGLELGIPPIAAMTGIHVIEGKIALSATLLGALVKRSGKYDYRAKHEKDLCAIAFFERGEQIGESVFTLKDAEVAGLAGRGPWKTYLRNMLFARALSNGVRWYCPDIFAGPIYTPEELGADVDEDGEPTALIVTEPGEPPRRRPSKAESELLAHPRMPEVLAHAAHVLEANDIDTLTAVSRGLSVAGLPEKLVVAVSAFEQLRGIDIEGGDAHSLDESRARAANWLLAQLPGPA